MTQPVNYFAAWDGIVAALREIPDFRGHVYPFMRQEDAKKVAQSAPGAIVLYERDRVGGEAGRGQAQVVEQMFTVVVAISSSYGADAGDGAREQAGALITAVLAKLSGLTPATGWLPLRRADRPALVDYEPGLAWFPFGFSTTLITHP